MRGPDGEAAVLEKNAFVERILPASVARGLSPEAHARYREPFADPAHRWPTLEWPRQLPIENVPPKDRKSTRLNSSHANISYAVFCLKKKKTPSPPQNPPAFLSSSMPRG